MSRAIERISRTELGEPDPPTLRGWSHVVAAVLAVTMVPIVMMLSADRPVRMLLFSIAVVMLFTTSGMYHRVFWQSPRRSTFKRIDQSMIYLSTAAMYNAIIPFAVPGRLGTYVLWAAWGFAFAGVALKAFWPDAPPALTYILFVVLGWTIAPVLPQVWVSLGLVGFALVLIGGFFHSAGGIVFAIQWPNPSPNYFGFHEIFHLGVIFGVAAHYLVVLRILT